MALPEAAPLNHTAEEYRRLLERLGDAEDLALIEERRSEPDMFVSSVDELNALLAGD